MFPEKHHTETEASYFAWQLDSRKIYKIMNFLSFELRVCIYTKVCNKKLQANKVTTIMGLHNVTISNAILSLFKYEL